MRKPDNTLIFGSSGPASGKVPNSVRGPVSRGPVSMGAPASKAYEKQWFNQPVIDAPPSSIAPTRPVGADLLAERRGFIPRSPERGLAFAAIALTLIGIAGAGTYFFFGIPDTAHNLNGEVGTTTVTNAELTPATATPVSPPLNMATLPNVSWTPPVVDAVKSPNLPTQTYAPQQLPVDRSATEPGVNVNALRTAPTAHQVPANAQQVDDANHIAAGFYPQPFPNDTTLAPPPIQQLPSAGSPDVTTHMTPENTDNTLHNPQGEPALNQGIRQ